MRLVMVQQRIFVFAMAHSRLVVEHLDQPEGLFTFPEDFEKAESNLLPPPSSNDAVLTLLKHCLRSAKR